MKKHFCAEWRHLVTVYQHPKDYYYLLLFDFIFLKLNAFEITDNQMNMVISSKPACQGFTYQMN